LGESYTQACNQHETYQCQPAAFSHDLSPNEPNKSKVEPSSKK
jgi:hypothetical protein